jgi:UDP-N-acetylmuramoyl-L-alanyl-D-glutamate--2,6-diaminopimelate ligase
MNLQQLFRFFSFSYEKIDPLTEVKSLCLDSRLVEPGSVFFAMKGSNRDGHEAIPEVIEKGAVAIVCSDISKISDQFNGLVLQVQDVRALLSTLSARFYGVPSQSLFSVGVTGTNGKTSITYLVEHLLNRGNIPTAVMGTINHHFQNHVWATEMTTPDPIALQKRLSEFRDSGAKAVVMEVSSHALDQKRADSVLFDVGVFTNLTRDHLDYHKTMENYHEAKQRLFTDLMWKTSKVPCFAVINTDDHFGRTMKVAEPAEIFTYGQKDADFEFRVEDIDWTGTKFILKTRLGKFSVQSPLLGTHNVYNTVAAMAVGTAAGVPMEQLVESVAAFPGVPGRLQKVPSRRVNIFVDYAHTPDALEKVLSILKELRDRISPNVKIWCLFGCGGDRDKGKRPLMAQMAAKFADHVVVTSDNPRTEDPEIIMSDIATGFGEEQKNKTVKEVNRRKAIEFTLAQAAPGDVILIAGKGHEDYQIIGTQKFDFDDYKIATEIEKGIS